MMPVLNSAQKSPNEKDNGSIYGKNSNSANSGPKSPNSMPKKDPIEEFFMFTLLAYKLSHSYIEKILNVRH